MGMESTSSSLSVSASFDPLFPRLTETKDATAADVEAEPLRQPDRPDIILVVVGGAYLREEAPGGLKVVVVAVETRLLELQEGLLLHDPQ